MAVLRIYFEIPPALLGLGYLSVEPFIVDTSNGWSLCNTAGVPSLMEWAKVSALAEIQVYGRVPQSWTSIRERIQGLLPRLSIVDAGLAVEPGEEDQVWIYVPRVDTNIVFSIVYEEIDDEDEDTAIDGATDNPPAMEPTP